MADEQKRVRRRSEPPPETATETAPAKAERRNAEDVDKLIAEIDDVLEENAEEFVRSYVQKGGE